MIKKAVKIIPFLILILISGCKSENDLMEEVNNENSNNGNSGGSVLCTPRNNTIVHDNIRIVYDDIFYSNLWPGISNILQSGKGLKGQDNNTGSQLNIEFNLPLTEGDYTVQDYYISNSIADDEVVVYGSYPINGSKYDHFAEPGTIVRVKLLSNGKWSASFCDSKFTVASWTGWPNNFTTDGNLIQTYP
jgi:hypothetical protein